MSTKSVINEPVPTRFFDGTYRTVSPQQTLARIAPLMRVMGITRIADVTGLDSIGIPVVMVSVPNARSLSVTQGKGLTLYAAKASGLMEAVERYHAETVTLPLKLATFDELRFTHNLLDSDKLPRVKGSFFHRDYRLLWAEGYDLLQDESVWLPYEMVHIDYTLPPPSGSGCFPTSSTGLASGNHLLEATVHGLYEVIERDALTLWQLRDESSREDTRIDLDSVGDPACRAVLDKYAAAGIFVAVYEITSDIGLPAFNCLIIDESDHPLRRLGSSGGMGCHATRHVALLRALTEAAQSRLTTISGARDDIVPGDYEKFRATSLSDSHLALIHSTKPSRRFGDVSTSTPETFNHDLAFQLERLHAVGVNHVILFDLTKAPLGIPVVRVVVPELEDSSTKDRLFGARAQRHAQALRRPDVKG